MVRFLGLGARGQRHCFTGHINLDGECYITHDLKDVGGRLGLGGDGGRRDKYQSSISQKSLSLAAQPGFVGTNLMIEFKPQKKKKERGKLRLRIKKG